MKLLEKQQDSTVHSHLIHNHHSSQLNKLTRTTNLLQKEKHHQNDT